MANKTTKFSAAVLLFFSFIVSACDDASSAPAGSAVVWPPRLGQAYPDLEFTNHDGRKLRLSDFKGKVVLVEPVGMTCQACNAFAGGNSRGSFRGIPAQRGLKSIEEYLQERLDGLSVDNSDLVLVQLLLYDLFMEAPDGEDARIWAEHFGFDDNPNIYVVFSERDLRGKASFRMIPGFYLLDRNSVVRADSTGHHPRHSLFAELLPMIPRILAE